MTPWYEAPWAVAIGGGVVMLILRGAVVRGISIFRQRFKDGDEIRALAERAENDAVALSTLSLRLSENTVRRLETIILLIAAGALLGVVISFRSTLMIAILGVGFFGTVLIWALEDYEYSRIRTLLQSALEGSGRDSCGIPRPRGERVSES